MLGSAGRSPYAVVFELTAGALRTATVRLCRLQPGNIGERLLNLRVGSLQYLPSTLHLDFPVNRNLLGALFCRVPRCVCAPGPQPMVLAFGQNPTLPFGEQMHASKFTPIGTNGLQKLPIQLLECPTQIPGGESEEVGNVWGDKEHTSAGTPAGGHLSWRARPCFPAENSVWRQMI